MTMLHRRTAPEDSVQAGTPDEKGKLEEGTRKNNSSKAKQSKAKKDQISVKEALILQAYEGQLFRIEIEDHRF